MGLTYIKLLNSSRTSLPISYRYKNRIDEVERAKNRIKSRVRSKVEHVLALLKLKFGFVKVRYRGMAKNANRLFTAFALVNLFMVCKRRLCPTAA
jgi:transposase, IS5 family